MTMGEMQWNSSVYNTKISEREAIQAIPKHSIHIIPQNRSHLLYQQSIIK